MKRTAPPLFLLTLVGVIVFATTQVRLQQRPNPADRFEVSDVMVPMRDGKQLFTKIFTPRDIKRPLPIIFKRTPYGIDGSANAFNAYYRALADEGYIFVHQDIRGKFRSEGEFVMQRPSRGADDKAIDEGTDTYDTIDWLIKNVRNNNGRVGMLGVSYDGWTTIVRQFKFDRYDTYDWYLDLGPLSNVNAKYLHGKIPTWNDYVAHPDYDEFWKRQTMIPHDSLRQQHVGIFSRERAGAVLRLLPERQGCEGLPSGSDLRNRLERMAALGSMAADEPHRGARPLFRSARAVDDVGIREPGAGNRFRLRRICFRSGASRPVSAASNSADVFPWRIEVVDVAG